MDSSRRPLLIHSKMRPPRLRPERVRRDRLFAQLGAARALPLTLVSAPAGYGKSVLVADWLAHSELPFGWVSLDPGDGDPSSFLAYLVSAVRSVAPGACPQSLDTAMASTLPSIERIAARLVNELDRLDTDLVLVLDDFHLARGPAVHELVEALLRHPPAPVHFVLIGRFDPALPLQSLRTSGQMEEIRQRDLELTAEEADEFFSGWPGLDLDAATVERFRKATEGWVLGLKLATLSLQAGVTADQVLAALERGTGQAQRFLLQEVLEAQPERIRQSLLELSIVHRLCRPLCHAMTFDLETGDSEPDPITWAIDRGLFITALDAQGEWFRLHQIFREALRRELDRTSEPNRVAELHRRAAVWFEGNDLPDEALCYYLEADRPDDALSLVKRRRIELMEQDRWGKLRGWLAALPRERVDSEPELLLLRAWIQEDEQRFEEMLATAAAAASLDAQGDEGILGEIETLESAHLYFGGQGEELSKTCRRALSRIPVEHAVARGFALALAAFGEQMAGRAAGAERLLLDEMRSGPSRSRTLKAYALAALGFVHSMQGDAASQVRVGREHLTLARNQGLARSEAYARYLLGLGLLESASLAEARQVLEPLSDLVLGRDLGNFTYGSMALGLVEQRDGAPEAARHVADGLVARSLELGDADHLRLTRAYEAEIAIRQGRLGDAISWARTFEPRPSRLRNRFFQPELTWLRVLLAEGDAASLRTAKEAAGDLRLDLESVHANRLLVDLLLLQALLTNRLEGRKGALPILDEAIERAWPLAIERPFDEHGEAPFDLLAELAAEGSKAAFLSRVRQPAGKAAAAGRDRSVEESTRLRRTLGAQSLIDELTTRELDVLELLARRLTNKEIAERLFISPATVKRHNANIFDKLAASGRRAAVERALELGILSE